jgi:glucokinase
MGSEARVADSAAVLADVGGTNVRFAVLRDGVLGPVAHMAVAGHSAFAEALAAFLAARTDRETIRHAIFGVAGVVEGDHCALTNNPWVIEAPALCARFGFGKLRMVNDFEAVAWSLP